MLLTDKDDHWLLRLLEALWLAMVITFGSIIIIFTAVVVLYLIYLFPFILIVFIPIVGMTIIIFTVDTKRYENYVNSIKDAYEKAVEDEI